MISSRTSLSLPEEQMVQAKSSSPGRLTTATSVDVEEGGGIAMWRELWAPPHHHLIFPLTGLRLTPLGLPQWEVRRELLLIV